MLRNPPASHLLRQRYCVWDPCGHVPLPLHFGFAFFAGPIVRRYSSTEQYVLYAYLDAEVGRPCLLLITRTR